MGRDETESDGAIVNSVEKIVLIGFSGSGKSTVARFLADRLGWTSLDTDDEIARRWGKDVPSIFREDGESAFRASERAVLCESLRQTRVVVATGGGAAIEPSAWAPDVLGGDETLVIALDARPETTLARLHLQAAREGDAVERPLLASGEPLARIRDLKESRRHAYERAHVTLATDGASAADIADEVAAISRMIEGQPLALKLEAKSGNSDIFVGPGVVSRIGDEVRDRWPSARRVWIVTDEHVGPLHAAAVENSLNLAGLPAAIFTVPAGEGSKSLGTVSELYDWLLGQGVERGDVLVALGGGVVGDLAGFVAATVLRGIGLVQAPTSLLAAVDSSVGGKTGINHAAGKNLIGAFLQPALVLADSELLRTMPARDLRSGWAEVVKHAVIQRSTPGGERGDLATYLPRNGSRLRNLGEPATSYLIWRNIGLKAGVVAADERESGIRMYLNFGHTLGHGIEAAGYHLLHGEAVALGMRAAAELGVLCDTCSPDDATGIDRLLETFALPRTAPIDEMLVLSKVRSDKKRVAGTQRYVLPLHGGGVEVRDDVKDVDVRRALSSVNAISSAAP